MFHLIPLIFKAAQEVLIGILSMKLDTLYDAYCIVNENKTLTIQRVRTQGLVLGISRKNICIILVFKHLLLLFIYKLYDTKYAAHHRGKT